MFDAPVIAIVDDDDAIREALDDLVQSLGFRSALFASAEAFLASPGRGDVDCMVVDVKMPGLSGLDLQDRLNTEGCKPPTIFMTSYLDGETRRRAVGGGARAFFGKPVDYDALIAAINSALACRGRRS